MKYKMLFSDKRVLFLATLIVVANFHAMNVRFGYGGYSHASVAFDNNNDITFAKRTMEEYLRSCVNRNKTKSDESATKLVNGPCNEVPFIFMNGKEVKTGSDEIQEPYIELSLKIEQPREFFEQKHDYSLEDERNLLAHQLVVAYNSKQKVIFSIADELSEQAKSWTFSSPLIDQYTVCKKLSEESEGERTLECVVRAPRALMEEIRADIAVRATKKNTLSHDIVNLYFNRCKKNTLPFEASDKTDLLVPPSTPADSEGLCKNYDNLFLYLGDYQGSVTGKVKYEGDYRVFTTYFKTFPDENVDANVVKDKVFAALKDENNITTGYLANPTKLDEYTRCDKVAHTMPPTEFRHTSPYQAKCTTVLTATMLAKIHREFENKI